MVRVELELDDEIAEALAARIDDAAPTLGDVAQGVLRRTAERFERDAGIRPAWTRSASKRTANDLFDPLCQVEFTDSQSGTKLNVLLGAPTFDESKGWHYCVTEIAGLAGGERKRIHNDGQFGALHLSLLRFRVLFSKLTGDFRDATGNSPHMLFPKEIPWVYGSDVYRRLCKMVEDEIQKIEDERTRRRESRSRGNKGS